jgi:exodeoxyribonuclease III
MKPISWNVNGIRALLNKGFIDFVHKEKPEILCLQETKAERVEINLPGYNQYWNAAEKKGYSGTAVFTKIKPISVKNGIGDKEHDSEGRVITCEFDEFYLVNVYTPNSGRGIGRLDYRQDWDRAFLRYVLGLEKRKPVIFCGDLNVAHKEIDLKNPKQNVKNAGFTPEERRGFDEIVKAGFVDSFRHLHPTLVKYTWWSYMFNARAKNIGWRIDYFVISPKLLKRLKSATILDKVMGSDHCPVGIEIEI